MTAASPWHPRRPILGTAIIYCLGTQFGLRGIPAYLSLALSLASAVLWIVLRRAARRQRAAGGIALLMAYTCILGASALLAGIARQRHFTHFEKLSPVHEQRQRISIRGTVSTLPSGHAFQTGAARLNFEVRIKEASPALTAALRISPTIAVECYGNKNMLDTNFAHLYPQIGEEWEFVGRLRETTRDPLKPYYTLSVRPADSQRLHFDSGKRQAALAWRLRSKAARTFQKGIENAPHATAILQAMILGIRGEMPRSLRSLFARSGTAHIFAISGLHVGIIATIIAGVLPRLRISRKYWFWVTAPLILGYTYLTGASPSAVRACTMTLLLLGATLVQRKPDVIASLGIAAVIQLVADPYQMRDVGFIFSFTCVIGIVTLAPLTAGLLKRPASATPADPPLSEVELLAQAAAPETVRPAPIHPWLRWIAGVFPQLAAKAVRFLRLSLATSIAVWLTSVPLTAMYFGSINPIAIISNLFAIPLAYGIVACGSLSLLGGMITPILSEICNFASHIMIEMLLYLTEKAVSLPGAHWTTAPWPHWGVAAWYAGLVALALIIAARRSDQSAAP